MRKGGEYGLKNSAARKPYCLHCHVPHACSFLAGSCGSFVGGSISISLLIDLLRGLKNTVHIVCLFRNHNFLSVADIVDVPRVYLLIVQYVCTLVTSQG